MMRGDVTFHLQMLCLVELFFFILFVGVQASISILLGNLFQITCILILSQSISAHRLLILSGSMTISHAGIDLMPSNIIQRACFERRFKLILSSSAMENFSQRPTGRSLNTETIIHGFDVVSAVKGSKILIILHNLIRNSTHMISWYSYVRKNTIILFENKYKHYSVQLSYLC